MRTVSPNDPLNDFTLLIGKSVGGWTVRETTPTLDDEAGVVELLLRLTRHDRAEEKEIDVIAVFAVDAHRRHARDPWWILQDLGHEAPLEHGHLYCIGWNDVRYDDTPPEQLRLR